MDTMIVLEELGKGLVLEPYISTVIFAGGILRHADEKSRTKFLPKLIGGEHAYAVAYAEAGSRFDLFHVETVPRATRAASRCLRSRPSSRVCSAWATAR